MTGNPDDGPDPNERHSGDDALEGYSGGNSDDDSDATPESDLVDDGKVRKGPRENAAHDDEAGERNTDAVDGDDTPTVDGDEIDTRAGERPQADASVPLESATPATRPGTGPHVSVTLEGEYDTVFERLEHPQALTHSELDSIVDNIEETLLAVLRTGGGIRSEIYNAATFDLDEPWEIRIYLEVLAMHDLVRLQDDRWVPSDYFKQDRRGGNPE